MRPAKSFGSGSCQQVIDGVKRTLQIHLLEQLFNRFRVHFDILTYPIKVDRFSKVINPRPELSEKLLKVNRGFFDSQEHVCAID